MADTKIDGCFKMGRKETSQLRCAFCNHSPGMSDACKAYRMGQLRICFTDE